MTQLNQAIAEKLHTAGLPLNPELVNKISAQAAQHIEAKKSMAAAGVEDILTKQFEKLFDRPIDALAQQVIQALQHDVQHASLPAIAELASNRQHFAKNIFRPSAGSMSPTQKQEFVAGMSEGIGEMPTLEQIETAQPRSFPTESEPTTTRPLTELPEPTEFGEPATSAKPSEQVKQPSEQKVPSIEQRLGVAEADTRQRYEHVVAETPDDLLARASNWYEGSASLKKKAQFHEYRGKKHLAQKIYTARGGEGGAGGYVERAFYRAVLGKLGEKAEHVGRKINQNIKEGKFSSFYIALILAVVKDVIDGLEAPEDGASIIAPILSFVLFLVLTYILWGEGTYFKVKIIKKLFAAQITMFIAELIPVLNVFPWYTISILLMEYYALTSIAKQKTLLLRQLVLLKKIKLQMRIYRLVNRDKELNPRQIRTIESELLAIEKAAA